MMYKLFTSITNQKFVICLSDNTYIPFAPDNTDYQTYLKWVAEGGVPTPADE